VPRELRPDRSHFDNPRGRGNPADYRGDEQVRGHSNAEWKSGARARRWRSRSGAAHVPILFERVAEACHTRYMVRIVQQTFTNSSGTHSTVIARLTGRFGGAMIGAVRGV
jgi:hypothetical protein